MNHNLKSELGQLLSELSNLIRMEAYELIPAKCSEIYVTSKEAYTDKARTEANQTLKVFLNPRFN